MEFQPPFEEEPVPPGSSLPPPDIDLPDLVPVLGGEVVLEAPAPISDENLPRLPPKKGPEIRKSKHRDHHSSSPNILDLRFETQVGDIPDLIGPPRIIELNYARDEPYPTGPEWRPPRPPLPQPSSIEFHTWGGRDFDISK